MKVDSKYPDSVKAGKPILENTPIGWKKSSLKNYLQIEQRKVKLDNETAYRLVTVKRSRGGVVFRDKLLGKQISVKSQFLVEENDFLISKRQIVHGACAIVPKGLSGSVVSNEYTVFTAKDNFDIRFLAFLSETFYFQQTCFHSSIGVHIEKMIFKLDDWFKWEFNIPPLPEQRKIAQILSTWDKAIATTEKQITNSKQQKKALMQQLLTGKKRLAGFSGDWKAVKLSQIANITMGSSPKSSAYNESQQGLPLLQGNADIKNRKSAPRIFTSQITKECTVNDILLSVRAPVGTVAKSKHHACIGRGIAAITATKDHCQAFIYQWLLNYEPKWERFSQGSTFEAVNSNDIKSLNMLIPLLKEQQKIAQVLTTADNDISTLETQLSHLQQEKKALMQQLLTGKRRVVVES